VAPRPGVPRHNIIFNSFLKISKPIFRLYGKKSKTCRPVFWPSGICNGRRVNIVAEMHAKERIHGKVSNNVHYLKASDWYAGLSRIKSENTTNA